ncbi:class I SAM-dependent methyltransferase [Calidifontibacillus erzurumensis]|uniref:Class I SAM-dependent methyltransferase n=1 Tax=Calidifontibacillus erzurumensis TaxID=2741433 RepID=A0A8J8GAA4_9BACI|nr:class I SAM-dependent methyltransferase [Calidifontibacillus erzurumensis]NSL50220.1 class I SAM-dependent methyltransferase [Calidifontibacillus erzurumensis]
MNALKMPAHLFLASLGKKMLRPGGRRATERIIQHLELTPDSVVLEVAPNMGTTAIHLAKTYGCKIYAVDIHGPSLEKAKENVKKEGLEDQIILQMGDARKLPFEDGMFDAVINEAMLTMLPNKEKMKAIQEYYRVLKPGGRLGTHDLTLKYTPSDDVMNEFWSQLKIMATPLTIEDWHNIFEQSPFEKFESVTGHMSLLSMDGLLVDEGWEGTIEILKNAGQSEETKERFFNLASFFFEYSDLFGHCTFHAEKNKKDNVT